MSYRIKINREWSCSHLGAANVTYPPGVYTVPDEMSDELGQRCLRSGRGKLVSEPERVKSAAPQNKMRNVPENKRA